MRIEYMPVSQIKRISDEVVFGLWKIMENVDSLAHQVLLSNQEQEEYNRIRHVKRIKEWLSARVLLKILCDELSLPYKGTFKDEFNKPHLIGLPWNISISHSFPYAIAMIHHSKSCGVDIEKAKPALFHISNRYLNEAELEYIHRDPQSLCAAWTAKEVLYKIYGRKHLSFKKNLLISPFKIQPEGHINGQIRLDMGTGDFDLHYFLLDNYVVCYST